jgi:predicted transcriptional regulator
MPNVFHPHRSGAAVAVGPLEADILDILWDREGMVPIPDVHAALTDAGQTISYSAVKAVLNNLTQKGWLEKGRSGKVTCFAPLKSREQFDSIVIGSVISALKRNYGAPVIAQFVDQLAVDENAIEEFERLIAARKAELGR